MRWDRNLRASIGRLLAPTVWISGAVLAAFTWFSATPLYGVAVLGASVVVTLLLARLAMGWRAVPVVFALVGLLSPAVLLLGSAHLHRWVGSSGAIGLDSESAREWRSFLCTMIGSAVLAAPCSFLLGMGDKGFARLRAAAVRMAPIIVVAAVGISTYSAVPLVRRPSAETYAATLPLVTTIPPSAAQSCTPLDEQTSEHLPRSPKNECITEETSLPPLSFHYHCNGDERTSCALYFRVNGHPQEEVIAWREPIERSIDLHWDPSLDKLIVRERSGELHALDRAGDDTWLSPLDLGSRVGPPVGWFVLAASGLGFAFVAGAALWVVRRSVDMSNPAHRSWLERLRGDLAIVTIGTVLVTSALLVSTLFAPLLP